MKDLLKINITMIYILILSSISAAQQVDTTREFINYRRTDPNNIPPTTNYQQPKEQVFPLGYGTNHLGKVTAGTGVWKELNPKVPRVSYFGIDFINPDTGWAAGGSGAIIKTTNGGDDWSIAETPVTSLLFKIHSYNGQVVIAVGFENTILRSSDGGETFEQVQSGLGNDTKFWGVQMLNDTLGWICGMNQTLLKTTDAGINWQQVFPGLNQHYWSLDFFTEQFGFIAAGGGKVLKTTDGGISWQQYQAGDTEALYTIDIIDSLHIAAAGGLFGKNVYSSDGGITWVQNNDLGFISGANWIQFVDTDTGYITGGSIELMKTTNRGQEWVPIDLYFEEGEWQFELLPELIGYGVGSELTITKTVNGYDNWEQLILNFDWSDVFFIDEMKGFFISSYVGVGLYKTEDGGVSYQKIENAPGGYDLLFLDSLTGFIGGTHKTTDGGETWYATNGGGRKVFFINDSIGWSIDSHIYKTTDGGENWFVQLTLPADNFTSIFFVDSLSGWATSRYIWQTTDGGENWIERTDIPILFSDDVYFTDIDTGFVIEFLNLYKTTDSGNTWTTQLNSVYIIRNFGWLSKTHGFIIGDGMYETTNKGSTWNEILELRNVGLRKFQSPTEFLGYSVGNTGLIYRYLDTTYVPVELTSFKGYFKENKIVLEWETASELNNEGFIIEKSKDKIRWKPIGFLKGDGTTTEKNKYQFYDYNLDNDMNYYRLKQIDFNGAYKYSNIIEITYPITSFDLSQNYPNPFNLSTIIKYTISEKTFVKIDLYDIKGEKVEELVSVEKDKGIYTLKLNDIGLTSGVYFYRMTTSSGYSAVKKLIILK